MFRFLICCLLGGVMSEVLSPEYGLPVSGVVSQIYNQNEAENQIQNQDQAQAQVNDRPSAPYPGEAPALAPPGPEQAIAEGTQQQELPYPSDVQQQQGLQQQGLQQQPSLPEQPVQLAEAPQPSANTYGLPPASGQGSDISLDHPLDEQPQQVVAQPSPPAQPSEVYGLPPDGQSLPAVRSQYYTSGTNYQQKYQPNTISQNQYRGTQYRNYADQYKAYNQYPNQYQQYRRNGQYQTGNQYREGYQQGQYQQGQYQQGQYQQRQYQRPQYNPNDQYRRNSYPNYAGQYRQSAQYQNRYQYPQGQYQKSQQGYRRTNLNQQLRDSYQNPVEGPYEKYSAPSRQSSQYKDSQYQQDQYRQYNRFAQQLPGQSGYQEVQTSQKPVRYILLFQRKQVDDEPETSSVSYLSHPIPQNQQSRIQEVDSLQKLVETDEVPIVLPVPKDFQEGSSYGSASSTFVSKDSPGYNQQQYRLDRRRNGDQQA